VRRWKPCVTKGSPPERCVVRQVEVSVRGGLPAVSSETSRDG
jgi:hypothetical protein